MELISMTDFIIDSHEKCISNSSKSYDYALFLKQFLEIWMFVPCYFRDGVWIPYTKETLLNSIDLFNEFEQAKEKVLFSGFEVIKLEERDDNEIFIYFKMNNNYFTSYFNNGLISEYNLEKTIEDLVKYKLELTVKF